MKKITNVFSVVTVAIALVAAPFITSAQEIPAITVSDHCTVVDTDNVSHEYSGQYLGICALQAAIDGGSVSGVQFSNAFPSLGLFVTTIGGVAADPSSQYWALYQNGNFASVGLSQLPVAAGDAIMLELHDFSDTYLGHRLTITIGSLSSSVSAPAPHGGDLTLHDPFNVPLALAFIAGAGHADGSFDTPVLSDWAALAFAGGGAGDAQKRLAQYFVSNPPAEQAVTDYERHAMALEALGIDPYAGTGTDYVTPIVKAFDGTQVGNTSLVNDDIFALFPLLHAGYDVHDEIIQKTAAFILSKQAADGSWEESVDLTASAIQALSLVHGLPGAPAALTAGLNYVHAQEQVSGAFGPPGQGNSFSTSWVLQAIAGVPDSSLAWSTDYRTPRYYLATLQQADGGVEPVSSATSTRIWATEYAIPAVTGKTWDSLLSSFGKPIPNAPAVATSTPLVATSTPTAPPQEQKVVPQLEVVATAPAETKSEEAPPAIEPQPAPAPEPTSEPAPENQTAAAAQTGLLDGLWKAIVSFFSRLF